MSTYLFKTTQGDFKVKLFPKVAPKACENFEKLVAKKYYNGTIFHRIIKDFMIQGGDPTGTGSGGESCWGKEFDDECDPEVQFNRKGLLAMANRGPGTNGSQFFITTVPTDWLNGNHTIFGEVIDGYNVVKILENVETDVGDKPKKEQKVRSIVKVSEK